MKREEKILVIASAGGHLTQAMCATSNCNNIVLVSNKINIESKNIKKSYKIIDVQFNVLLHLINIFFAAYVLLRERPTAVFSTGGPIVLPFALLCKLLPIKFVFLDTLSRVNELSNSGKLINRFSLSNEFYSQWKSVANSNHVDYIGKCFDILGENKYNFSYQSKPTTPKVLVTVGTNQYDFERLLDILYTLPAYNDSRVEWVIQANHNVVKKMPALGKVVELLPRNEIEDLVKTSSLVISHCGIGSINLMLRYQKKVVFVPRVKEFDEFSDDHQLQIANEISSDNFSVVYPQEDFPEVTFESLAGIDLLSYPVDVTNHAMASRISQILLSGKKAYV